MNSGSNSFVDDALSSFQSPEIKGKTLGSNLWLSFGTWPPQHNFPLKLCQIPGSSGLSLSALYSEPQPKGKSPHVVVFVHGFCGSKDENGLFIELARHFVEQGIGVILYDWRGLGESEGEFVQTDLNDHISDFRKLVRMLQGPTRNPNLRVSALGFSLGATIIGRALQQGIYLDSVAYVSPAVRPRLSMWPRYAHEGIQKAIQDFGYFQKDGCGTKVGAPMLRDLEETDLGPNAFALSHPLFVCWGTNDSRIACNHNRSILQASRSSANSLAYLELKNASHSLRPTTENWPIVGRLLADWFSKDKHEPGFRALDSATPAIVRSR